MLSQEIQHQQWQNYAVRQITIIGQFYCFIYLMIFYHSFFIWKFSIISFLENVIIHTMNIKKLPPIPSRSGKRVISPLQQLLNQDHNVFKVIPKPLSKQSVQLIDQENEQNQVKRYHRVSIQREIPRCRSTKNMPNIRPMTTERSMTKNPKQQISGRQVANLPYISAKSWAIFQINTNKLVYGKRQDIKRQVASLTKIANLITILEILMQHNLDSSKIMVTVTKQAASMIGTTAQIKEGMIISLNDLFYGMMLPSGNDAAFQIALIGGAIINLWRDKAKFESIIYNRQALANYVNKHSNHVMVYLNKMNTIARFKAKTINTSFANPHGLSNVNSLSTAEDMARLSAYAMKNEKFREVVQTKHYTSDVTYLQQSENINDQNVDPNVVLLENNSKEDKKLCTTQFVWQNTNKMLWKGFSGIKTGITPNAGPCLSASVKKTIDGKDYQFVMILLKSYSMQARWKQVQGLAEWTVQHFRK